MVKMAPCIKCFYNNPDVVINSIYLENLSLEKKEETEMFLGLENPGRKLIRDPGWVKTTNLLLVKSSEINQTVVVGYFIEEKLSSTIKNSLLGTTLGIASFFLPVFENLTANDTLLRFRNELFALLGIPIGDGPIVEGLYGA